jgi:hypothetical protein
MLASVKKKYFSLPNRLFFMLASLKKSLFFTLKLLFFTLELLFFTQGEPTPSTLTLVPEKSLTLPLPLREIRA